jgi:hypothetical protein
LDAALRAAPAAVNGALKEIRKTEEERATLNKDVIAFNKKAKELAADVKTFNQQDFPDPTERKLLAGRVKALEEEERKLKTRSEKLDRAEERVNKIAEELEKKAHSRPPEFTVWSGVRERGFAGDVADFLAPERPERVFRFMVQVAFTSPPQFLQKGEGAAADYTDENPYEFIEIEEKVNEKVAAGLKGDPEAAAAVAEMAAFTRLQRLFRAGLAGKLGGQFPESRLVDLATDLGRGDPAWEYARTFRWLPHPGSVEVAGMTRIATASGVSNKDLESIRESRLTDDQFKTRLRDVTMARLDVLAKSGSADDRNAAAALRRCFLLLEEGLNARDALLRQLRRVPVPDSAAFAAATLFPGTLLLPPGFYAVVREQLWDAYEANLARWLVRWEEAATALAADEKSPTVIKGAVQVIADTDYRIQARLRMRVIDDERYADLQGRGKR